METFPIIGHCNTFRTRRDGIEYKPICVIDNEDKSDWTRMKTVQLGLTREEWGAISIETTNGLIFAKDDTKYYLEIDYDRRGNIRHGRIYNK